MGKDPGQEDQIFNFEYVGRYKLTISFEPRLSNTDPILLIYTSGTTGRPKGVLQTHEGSVMIDRLTAEALGIGQNDVYLAFMPYFHQAGLIRTRATINNGETNLLAGKIDPQSLVSTIVKKRVFMTMLVPPYDTRLAESADREKLALKEQLARQA